MKITFPRLEIPATIPGAGIFNRWIDQIVSAIENAYSPSATGNITVSSGKAGMHFHVPDFPIGIGLTTSTITARVTTTLGSGTADLKLVGLSGTNLVIVADPARTNQKVYNFSAATGGVATGKYFIWIKIAGYYFVVSVEC